MPERSGRAIVLAFATTAAAAGIFLLKNDVLAFATTSATADQGHEERPRRLTRTPLWSGDRQRGRALSIALPDGGCQITFPLLADRPITPVWQASFPGSGSRMTWSLVEALTGIQTSNDYDSHGRGFERVVAVKTHHPVKSRGRSFDELDPLFNRCILVLRNPINAIPSIFNLIYEHLNHLPNHSTRGPNEDWVDWRESRQGLSFQMQRFEDFVSFWMEKYADLDNLLLLSFEDVTSETKGPLATMQIAKFLGQTEGVVPIEEQSVPCVWQTIVKYKSQPPPPQNSRRLMSREKLAYKISSLRTGPKERPYTASQLEEMIAMFERLINKYPHHVDLVRMLRDYVDVATKTASVEHT